MSKNKAYGHNRKEVMRERSDINLQLVHNAYDIKNLPASY